MTQVFVSGIPGYSTLTFNNEFKTIFDVKVALKERLSFLENTDFQLLKQSQYMKEDDEIKTNSHPLELSFRVPCLGGKGAFGSKLKTQGKRLSQKKVSNFDSCRDLAGRRIKTVNEATQLADYIEQEPERRRLEQERLQKKIEEGLKEPIIQKIRFDDQEFEKNHEKVLEIMDQALGAGLKKAQKNVKVAKKSKKVSVWESSDSSESD